MSDEKANQAAYHLAEYTASVRSDLEEWQRRLFLAGRHQDPIPDDDSQPDRPGGVYFRDVPPFELNPRLTFRPRPSDEFLRWTRRSRDEQRNTAIPIGSFGLIL